MINRYARTASAAAVGAIIAGLLPGVASAAAAPVVAVTPPAEFKSGAAALPTPFKLDLTGADTAKDVSVRFTLSGPRALDKPDVKLEAFDAVAKTWSLITFDDVATGTVRGTYATDINLPIGATKSLDLRVQIADPIVDGPLHLATELVDKADASVLATDNDELDVTGVAAPKMTITPLGDVQSGKPLEFTTTASNDGRELYSTAMKFDISAATVPAGSKLFLQRHSGGPYWYDVAMTGAGGSFTTTDRRLAGDWQLGTDQSQETTWRVVSSDPSVLGKVTVTAALIDQDAPSTALATATTEGNLTPSTVDVDVAVSGFATTLKTDTPASGTITVTNNNATETFTGQARISLDGSGLGRDYYYSNSDVNGTWLDAAAGATPVGINFELKSGKIVGDIPVDALAAAGGVLTGTVTLNLTDNGLTGPANIDVSVAAGKAVYKTAPGTLQLEATTTMAQLTGVQIFGAKAGQAAVSWNPTPDPDYWWVEIEVQGPERDTVNIGSRSDVSRTLSGLPAGVPVTVAVRTMKYDYNIRRYIYSVPVFKTYTAPAVALPKPTDLRVSQDQMWDYLDERVSWKGTADFYLVRAVDKKTGDRSSYRTGLSEVFLGDQMMDTTPGHTYEFFVAAYDDAKDRWGEEISITYTAREPVASGAKLITLRGTNVVTWKKDAQALYSVTVNGTKIPVPGSSFALDRFLVDGTNTVLVTGENRHGTDHTELTVTSSTVKAAASARKVVFGDAVRFSGTIAATPLAGRSLQVEQYNSAKKVWASVAKAKTNAKGEYAASVKPSRTANYRVVLLVSGNSAGARSAVTAITVAPKTSLTASDTSVRRGETVTLTAKAAGAAAGTKVTFQQLVGNKWKTVGTAKVAKGAASVKVKMTTRGTVSLRAVVAGNSATTGATSGTVKVTVK